ncbi:hypothetical protein OUZ56_011638 [Daphnia magna]|uniref:Uncharacterized protein n=1 Tax=Daphnia magna TaxID=35525 RepID=A0ABQ9Z0P8_9CRUS|nr:hypothetical protein OUZ56_011638 [Daphnia magna]
MYSTSDPDICRTSDGLPCVMWGMSMSNCRQKKREDIAGECLLSLTEKQIDDLSLSIDHSIKLQKLVKNLIVENATSISRKNNNSSAFCANDTIIELQDIDNITYVNENITDAQADPLS